MMKSAMSYQPTICLLQDFGSWMQSLGKQPSGIRVPYSSLEHRPDSARLKADIAPNQALGREEGHLGIVRDRTPPAVSLEELPHALVAEPSCNLGRRREFNRGSQRVAYRTAKQTPSESFLQGFSQSSQFDFLLHTCIV